VLLALGFFGRGKAQSSDALGTVTRGDLRQQVTIAGTVVSRRRTLVTAPYNGYVKKLYVKVGDQVKAGDPLVSVAQSLNVAEPVFPLRAPYAGTVMYVQKYEGEHVKGEDTNDFLLRIDDLSALFIQATTPEVDRLKLKAGQEAVIKASAVLDRPYKGVIRELTLAPKEGNSSGGGGQQSEYPVRVEVTERDQELGPGMSVVVDIITAEKEKVLQLPHEYVLRDKDGYSVTLADGTRRPVKVGMQSEEAFEITEGLMEGERVRAVDFSSLPEIL
jgi:multidrug efflux pump subunit AcrA (membrane-fusion protein)